MMRKSPISALLLAGLLAGCVAHTGSALPLDAPPPEPTARPIAFPAQATATLDDGLTVIAIPMPTAGTVSLSLVMPGGDACEPKDRAGLASFTADALKHGTRSRTATELATAVDALGASLSFECGPDACTAHVEALTRNLAPTLALLGEQLAHPAFPGEELETQRGEWLTWLAYQETQPSFQATRLVHTLLYGDHPYAHTAPTAASLAAIDRDAVVRYHREHMTPAGATLVAAGDVELDTLLPLLRGALADWKAPETPPAPAPPLPDVALPPTIHLVDRPGAVQAVIAVAHRAPARQDPGYVALRVADEVLGGGPARRLFQILREEKGLTYGASAALDAQALGGHTVATLAVRVDKAAEALQALLDQIAALRAVPVTDTELTDATRYLAGALALRLDHPAQIAGLVARQRLLGLPADTWSTWPERVRAVDVAAVRAAADRLWPATDLAIVAVGPADELEPALARILPVTREPSSAR